MSNISFNNAEKNAIKKEFEQTISNSNAVDLDISKITKEVYEVAKNSNVYKEKITQLGEKRDALLKGIQDSRSIYNANLAHKNDEETIEKELYGIVDETMAEVKSAFDLISRYKVVSKTNPIDIDTVLKNGIEEILQLDEFTSKLAENDLKNIYVEYCKKDALDAYEERYGDLSAISLKDVLTKKELQKQLKSAINYVDTLKLSEDADKKISKPLEEKRQKQDALNKEYGELTNELDSIFNPEAHSKTFGFEGRLINSDHHKTFKRLAVNYGYAKLKGISFDLENDVDYNEIKSALVRKEVLEQNKDEDKLYKWIIEMVDEDPSRKHEAVKVLKRTIQNIKNVDARVAEQLDESLPQIYLNVLASSKDDITNIGKTKDYLIINEDMIETKWKTNSEGFCAKTGLLKNFADYVEELNDVSEVQNNESGFFNKLAGGLKSIFGSTVEKSKTKIDIQTIEREIIRKHKYATGRRLEDIHYKDVIQIDDLINLARGLAVKQNNVKLIKSSVGKIKELKHDSSIEDILNTYLEAAEIGEMINHDTETLTHVRNGQFYAMDNYINKKSGWMYSAADKIGDVGNSILKRLGMKEYNEYDIKGDPNWNFNITAIQPKGNIVKYGVPLAIATGLLYLGSKVYEGATGEKPTTENNSVLGTAGWLEERFMELLLFGTATHFMPKSESGKTTEHKKEAPKKKETPKAPEAHHPVTPVTPAAPITPTTASGSHTALATATAHHA